MTGRAAAGARHPGVAARIESALRPLLGGPSVRLRAWDARGRRRPCSSSCAAHLALTRLLWHPAKVGAAQAYVRARQLEVHGDIGETLDVVRATVASRAIPPLTARRLARALPELARLMWALRASGPAREPGGD